MLAQLIHHHLAVVAYNPAGTLPSWYSVWMLWQPQPKYR
jgi:hypothetical protein